MKGIVFNLLEDAVSETLGPDAWDDVLDASGVEGAYTALGNYPDEELMRIVGTVSRVAGAPADQVVRAFGRRALPALVARYPEFVEPHETTRAFLLTLDDIIHRDVRKLYPGSEPPRFSFGEQPGTGALVIHYDSTRRLCSFAEGMIEGAADHFGESVHLEQPECVKRGDARCTLVAAFA